MICLGRNESWVGGRWVCSFCIDYGWQSKGFRKRALLIVSRKLLTLNVTKLRKIEL